MKTVEVIVEHAGKNLSAYIEGAPVITVGNDMREIEENIKEAIELYLEDNSNPCELLSGEFELKFKMRHLHLRQKCILTWYLQFEFHQPLKILENLP